jgi:micrococcal nuclease
MRLIFSLFIFFISCQTPTVNIVGVHDGDTYTTSVGEKIRLAYVDCPELSQEYGVEARNYAAHLILHRQVELIRKGKDKYGRTIAEVRFNGKFLDELLVEAGYAWTYRQYSTESLIKKQNIARNKRVGLWNNPHSLPPFIYRKNN